jgi:hypothetical protein
MGFGEIDKCYGPNPKFIGTDNWALGKVGRDINKFIN